MHPKVSIIIPMHNAEKWISAAIKSAISQSYSNIEIIIVNDGSTDNSLTISYSFLPNNKIKIIDQVKQGASVARNKALEIAGGEYIQYLDADDLLSSNKVEQQIILLNNSPKDYISVSSVKYFYDGCDPNASELVSGWPLEDTNSPSDWLIKLLGGSGAPSMVPLGAWLVPRNIADTAGPWNGSISVDDDGEYFARVVLASLGIKKSQCGCYYYRKYRTKDSLSNVKNESDFLSAIKALDSKTDHLLEVNNSYKARLTLAHCYMNLAVMGYPQYTKLSKLALERAKNLAGEELAYKGTGRFNIISNIVGWRVARRISFYSRRIGEKFAIT